MRLPEARRAAIEATAAFLVAEYNTAKLDAMAVGDRDLALGLTQLKTLHAASQFPWLAANLRDASSGEPLFEDHIIVDRAGHKVGILGLLSPTQAQRVVQAMGGEKPAWTVADPVATAKQSAAQLTEAGAEFIVVLSQLTQGEESLVAEAVPAIRLFLGGEAPGLRPSQIGDSVSVLAGNKGKHVAFTEVSVVVGGTAGPLRLGGQLQTLRQRIASATRRVELLETQLKIAEGGVAAKPANVDGIRRRLAGARAERQILAGQLEGAAQGDTAGTVTAETVSLGATVKDTSDVATRVETFRKKVPASPGH